MRACALVVGLVLGCAAPSREQAPAPAVPEARRVAAPTGPTSPAPPAPDPDPPSAHETSETIGTLEWNPPAPPGPTLRVGVPIVEPATSAAARGLGPQIEAQAATFSRCYNPQLWAHLDGEVELSFTMAMSGRVRHVVVLRGLGDGADLCLAEQVRRWTFDPGGVVRVTATVTFQPAS